MNAQVNTTSQTVTSALTTAENYLQLFAKYDNFLQKMVVSFGNDLNTENTLDLQSDWLVGDFSFIPTIEVRDWAEINGANGAFAGEKNRIYLSREFLTANAGNVEVVANVLLEEIGHAVDWELNYVDGLGDEGAIFSHLVRGDVLSEEYLQELRVEDDSAIVSLDGELVAIEQDRIDGTSGNDKIEVYHPENQAWSEVQYQDQYREYVIYGYGGDDKIIYGAPQDTIYGGEGDDTIDGGGFNYGEAGNDSLTVGRGYYYGGEGDDVFDATENLFYSSSDLSYKLSKTIDGGNGNDTIEYPWRSSGLPINIDLATEKNTYTLGTQTFVQIVKNIENVTGTLDNDIISGDAANNELIGAGGEDTINGGEGDDTIEGYYAYGGDGNDNVSGNIAYGGDGNDKIYAHIAYGGKGNDSLEGGEGNDFIDGGSGDDTLVFSSRFDDKDTLKGGKDDDTYITENSFNNNNGGIIEDTGGSNDALLLNYYWDLVENDWQPTYKSQLSPTLAQFSTGVKQDDTDLIIDIKQDGVANRDQDLTIIDFYERIVDETTGLVTYKKGSGYIENMNIPVDLSVTKTDSSDPAVVNEELTYTLTVKNESEPESIALFLNNDATKVVLTDVLPEDVDFVNAIVSQGTFTETDGTVTFELGKIEAGKEATAEITVIPTEPTVPEGEKPPTSWEITNTATVESFQTDTDESNNKAEETTQIEFKLAVNTNGDQPDADPNDGVPDVDLTKEGLQVTLRSAIEYANQNPGKDTVTFKIPAGNPLTIEPKSALPTITESVVIDGNSQPGINIDGSQAPVDTNGLTITGNDSIIKGLTIKGFQTSKNPQGGSGIVIQSSNNLIENNNVQNNGASGVSIVGNVTNNQIKKNEIFNNALNGVFISSGNQNKIENNSIYGNEDGIDIRTSNSNEIYGNKIGETATVYNRFNGIKIVNGNNNKIGSTDSEKGNTIAFNQNSGVSIASGIGNSIRGNSIFGNGIEGIDLNDNNELDVNDNGDTDTGANQLQNYPVLTSVKPEKDFVSFKGNINGLPKQVYQLDFFAQQQVDSEQIYLGSFSIETDQTGNVNSEIEEIDGRFNAKNRYIKGFEVSFATDFAFSEDTVFTATATNAQGNTSEFFPWDYFYDIRQNEDSIIHKFEQPDKTIDGRFFAGGLNLSEVLDNLGLKSFNWLQSVKYFPSELELEVWKNPQTKKEGSVTAPIEPEKKKIENIKTPFVDVIVGKNNYFSYRNKNGDTTSWIHPDQSTPPLTPTIDNEIFYFARPDLPSYTSPDNTIFQFVDTPQQAARVFPGDGYIEFETRLVGVDAQGNYIDWDGLGTNFTWKSNTVFSGDVLGNKVVEGGIFDVKIEGKQSNKFPVEDPVIKNNYLNGSSAPDKLVGGEGNDTLVGGGGKDTLNGGNDNDTYQLNAKTAKGSQIIDSHGNDVLILEGWGEGKAIIDRKGKDLIIDLNQDGKANPQQDITIKNFFDDNKTNKPGKGFIETVKNVATGTEIKGEEIINAVTHQNTEEAKNDKNDDTYKFNAKNAKGAKIADSKGEDILKLGKTNISLTGLAKGKTGFKAQGKDLIIDINKDGKANAKQDLTIKNFFANNKANKPGKGFIETVDNVTGEEIIDSLTNPNEGITKNGNRRNNTLRGGKLDDVLNGKGGNDKLFGNKGNDTLTGGKGNDKLNGGKGEDILTGGRGKDSFVLANFNKTETDEITDFILGEDKLILDKSAFKAIKSRKGNGFSRKREFAVVDDAAEVASSRAFIVYNEESGELFYNSNGKKAGLGSGGLFAKLDGAPNIGATDFRIQP